MKNRLKFLCAAMFGLGLVGTAPAATTDGSVTFTVTLYNAGGNYQPRHVDAVWVTDDAGNFIKTLRREGSNWSGEGTRHLDQWQATRNGSQVIDGYTGATTRNYDPFTVQWNCRDANNTVVPDGVYKFFVETTDRNGQGPWTQGGIAFTKGPAPQTIFPPDLQYIKGMRLEYMPAGPLPHDVAVLGIEPLVFAKSTLARPYVIVTNLTTTPDSFNLSLSNLTTGTLIRNQTVNLAANAGQSIPMLWVISTTPVGTYLLEARATPIDGETSLADNVFTAEVAIRTPTHDVGITGITASGVIPPDTLTNIEVTASNLGDYAETFAVTLTDVTTSILIGSNLVSGLAAGGDSVQTFPWDTAGLAPGYHTLRASAASVTGELELANNDFELMVPVAASVQTVRLVPMQSVWRYNDTGIDLTQTPWRELAYYDTFWAQGPGPLGYGELSGLNTDTLQFGPDSDNKYPTYYFRQTFNADFLPLELTLRLRRDDGAVVYLNGEEIARDNMPDGLIAFTNLATTTISGAAELAYYSFSVPASKVRSGANVLAVEVHQSTQDSPDLSFDLELEAVVPQIPAQHEVAAVQVSPVADALAGDLMPVAVTITNQGNITETVIVILQDTTADQILGTQSVGDVAPNSAASVQFNWQTLGATAGGHQLAAYTVVNGVTNLAGTATATATISGTGLGANAVNALGTIGGRCTAVATSGNHLLLGAGAALEIFDKSTPTTPVKLAALRLPGVIEDIVVAGSEAYVACGNAGVQIVNIATPANPVYRTTFDSSGHAYGLAVSGTYLYVADGASGLRILDISNPASPSIAGSYHTTGPARAVAVSGSTAYVVDLQNGVVVLNVSSPQSPTLLGASSAFDAGQALAVAGANVYVVDGNRMLHVIDVSTPNTPTAVANFLLSAVGQAVTLDGSVLHVAAGNSGLLTVDVSTPSAPEELTPQATPGEAADVTLDGASLYLAEGFAGFQVYDVSSPTAPSLQGEFAEGVRAADVVVANGKAYVGAGEAGLQIYDLANPAAPVLLSRFTETANARCLALAGNMACVGDSQYGLKLVDVADPAHPALLGTLLSADLSYLRSIAAVGTQVIVTDGRKIGLVDASDAAHPVLSDTYDAPAFAYAVAVAGSHAYAACGNAGLLILNVGANSLSLAGSYDTPGLAQGVAVAGTTAFVADGGSGWLTLDVTDPAAPALLQSSSSEGPVRDIAVSGVLAALGSGANSAQLLDVTTPVTPVPQQAFGPLVHALRVALNGQVTLTAEDEAGVAILGMVANPEDTDHDGLPDDWEMLIVNANPNDAITGIEDVLPTDDFDGDSLSNYAEYLAGTSATDPSSKFMVQVNGGIGGTGANLQWDSVAGRIYTIYRTTNLADGFTELDNHIPATPPRNTYPLSAGGGTAFYIISVR